MRPVEVERQRRRGLDALVDDDLGAAVPNAALEPLGEEGSVPELKAAAREGDVAAADAEEEEEEEQEELLKWRAWKVSASSSSLSPSSTSAFSFSFPFSKRDATHESNAPDRATASDALTLWCSPDRDRATAPPPPPPAPFSAAAPSTL